MRRSALRLQDATAAGRTLAARGDGRLIAVRRQQRASGADHHRCPALIEHLAPDDVLCHSDLHSGNVIMTAQGPGLID
ncbi:phosphotransferase [Bradyrhizobium sp. CCBAU 53421]|uniref:phosphotransferase n=1 Tax=Bradyrhizobium sp. CCBAU 53421 TaxID=1325120 RepID=UPI0018C1B2F7|nr:hypothetical protein XH92_15115 [Bradyrhizobium sp. CCBAU 53421]